MARLKGTGDDDRLRGGDDDDRIHGRAGDDFLVGNDGNDILFGNSGNDMLVGGGGVDVLRGGHGADMMLGGSGDDIAIIDELNSAEPDTFDGGGGIDVLTLAEVTVSGAYTSYWSQDYDGRYTVDLYGAPPEAPDALTFTGVETLIATRGADLMVLVSSTDNLAIDAGAGDDWLRLGYGNNLVLCGTGNDRIDFGLGRISYYGESGNDYISVGSATGGSAYGGTDTDTIGSYHDIDLARGWAIGSNGEKIVIGGFENISLVGAVDGTVARGDDNDNVMDCFNWPSNFVFFGAGGDDRITGGDGSDQLSGGGGDDVLEGGYGVDQLTGGGGADIFRFTQDFSSRPVQTDTVADFSRDEGDKIDLTGFDADPSTPTLDGFQFIGAAAFSGSAGELRAEVIGGETYVQGDTNGDAAADLSIRLVGAVALECSDFLLYASDGAGRIASFTASGEHSASSHAYVDPVLP